YNLDRLHRPSKSCRLLGWRWSSSRLRDEYRCDGYNSFRPLAAGLANKYVESRRKQKAESGDSDHSEEHSGAQRLAHLRARAAGHCEREHTENEGKGGHQDWAETDAGGGRRGLLRLVAVVILPLPRELHDQDRVLGSQPHQHHEADLCEDVDWHSSEVEACGRSQ